MRLWTEANLPDYAQVMDRYDLRGYHPTITSDVFRVIVVHRYGGIYFDSDIEPLACVEPLLAHSFFCRYDGTIQIFAGKELRILSGYGFGAEPESPILAGYMERCEALRDSGENILYRAGFLGLSEHLWNNRSVITMLTKHDMETYCRHEGRMGWSQAAGYRPIFEKKTLQEPFKKGEKPAARPWPSAEEMLRHHRGPEIGCCGRPSKADLRR
jgi:hypothetical protein